MRKTDLLTSFEGDPKSLTPLALAFVGDGVFELLVRGNLIKTNTIPVRKLHRMTVKRVNATAQANAFGYIWDAATPDEQDILRRGRNAKIARVPKSASIEDYHKSTGVEALFGYLYLKGETDRIVQLFQMITDKDFHEEVACDQ